MSGKPLDRFFWHDYGVMSLLHFIKRDIFKKGINQKKVNEEICIMKKQGNGFLLFIMILFMITFFVSCGDSIHNKAVSELQEGSYPNASLLISGDSLEASIGDSKTVVIDTRASGYTDSHIPGAISLLWGDFTDESLNLKKLADLEGQLSVAGLNRNMRFIIYDDTTASWGAAGRIFWMLEYLGCKDVHILNGGWDKWVEDERVTETTINTFTEDTFVAEVQEDRLADKDHILNMLKDEDFVIIDSREDEEYNGWILCGETRGGHIRDAVSVNYKWFFNLDKTVLSYEDLKEIFASMEITTDKEVVSYSTAGIRSGYVYFALRLMGYEQCSNYDGSIYEWSADASAPMDALSNYHKLVYPGWVNELIADGNPGTAGTPPTYPGNGYVIVEAMSERGSDNTDDYDAGHIPGAIHLNIYALESAYPNYPYACPSDGNLLPDVELQAFIENMGIAYDTTVVIYGDSAVKNARAAWALMYAGVEDVRILNGGYYSWVANGGIEERTKNTSIPVSFGMTVPGHPEYLITTTDVQTLRADPTGVLADIRRWEEFIGAPGSNGYPHFEFNAEGRIPGAVWAYNSSEYSDSDGTFRSYTEVEQMWWDLGIKPNRKIAFY
ncbi:MAG: rhodanese-like domain-containing protein [Thermodesulfobacteriota bacterium]|nr:rhodanese-like domain-containing protein [Thermodesulfobacteriota bacterium]